MVNFRNLPLEQAQKSGAIHAFGEKYGDLVKVYTIGGKLKGDYQPLEGSDVLLAGEAEDIEPRNQVYSREFCGGPHVASTGEIKGRFKIQKDEKVSRDVVRIRAILE